LEAKVNLLRNPTFAQGAEAPARWRWSAEAPGASWSRPAVPGAPKRTVMQITSNDTRCDAAWDQEVRCKPRIFYRIEATVSLGLDGGAADGGDDAGFYLSVVPVLREGAVLERDERRTPAYTRTDGPTSIRACLRTPPGVNRLLLRVGVRHARGTILIHHARVIEIIEPEETAHPLAIPPPASAYPAPRVARSVWVCAEGAATRALTLRLAAVLDQATVQPKEPAELDTKTCDADAVFLPDGVPPPALRRLRDLRALAADRVVVISLPAFARLAGSGVRVRTVEQADDPIGAQIAFADFMTHGFALHDVFPFAWCGAAPCSFRQNQFRDTPEFRALCEKEALRRFLTSACNRDATTDRPVALFRGTEGGALVVLDVEPVEQPAGSMCEPLLPMHLLMCVLGHARHGLGQYAVPFESVVRLREDIRELGRRFPAFRVHDDDVPTDQVRRQVVAIGGPDESFGLPLRAKPLIVVRSGLTADEWESVYGAWWWFKQLVRMPPHACPYATELGSRFRFAWVPLSAEWAPAPGFARRANPDESALPALGGADGADVVIDVVSSGRRNETRVVFGDHGEVARRAATWLAPLFDAFPPGAAGGFSVPRGEAFSELDARQWGRARWTPSVLASPTSFGSPVHGATRHRGGALIRLELPAWDGDGIAQSIVRTDHVATLLEQVIGCHYGLVAMNRSSRVARLDGVPPVAPGEALIIPREDVLLRSSGSRAG
jgi:hypothetical protein